MSERKSSHLPSMMLVPAVAVAGLVAYFIADRGSAPASAPHSALAEQPPAIEDDPLHPAAAALPPDHPPIGAADTPNPHAGAMGPSGAMPMGDNQEAPSIKWTAPDGWTVQPNPSPMRLATYRVGDGAELSVVRAGGSTDANVKRWQGQFDGEPKISRTDKKVNGLAVTVVRIDGTFLGGGMMGGPTERHDGWSMLAAIVEAPGSPYFFKLVGPSAQLDQARKGFDALVASLTPRSE
jgi:hypothetical protein